MRVILKPGGLALILMSFGGLVAAIFVLQRTPTGARAALAHFPSLSAKNVTALQNASFESEYRAIVPYDNKATLRGKVAFPWQDDSSWARVVVNYSEDTTNPHSGRSSQRIDITSVTRGQSDSERDVVQLNQPLPLTQGKSYRASLWVRASAKTEVEISLRQAKWPYKYDAAKVMTVDKEWTEVSVTGPSTVTGDTYLMLKAWKPGTLWVDDARLEEVAKP